MDFIEAQMNAHEDIAERYAELGRLFERKLWHQLTGLPSTPSPATRLARAATISLTWLTMRALSARAHGPAEVRTGPALGMCHTSC